MKIEIKPVSNKTELKRFIDFPHTLLGSDEHYVPELYLAQKEIHNTAKNPYFQHSRVIRYLAYSNNEIVGRLAAHVSDNYNSYHKSNIGFFGFYDVQDNVAISRALFNEARGWLNDQGVDRILGPMNYSLSTDTGGILVDGFDSPPMVMMTYNPAYYVTHVEACGFEKEIDLYAYILDHSSADDKSVKLEKLLTERLRRSGITIRKFSKKDFTKEVSRVKDLYRKAWEKNWGFVPPTDAEFQHLAEGMKLVIDEDFAYVAEDGDKLIGFFIALPNINEITQTFKKGRLLPFNIIKLLLNKNKVKNIRVVLLGVIEEYRNKGIEGVFFAKNFHQSRKMELIGCEASWILENNAEMIKSIEKLKGKRYKTYRIYSQNL